MTEWKNYRPRKVVDYSKFISQDSDDDDFSDHSNTRPTKKSKLSSSDGKVQNNTQSSKKLGQELLAQAKHSNRNKIEAKSSSVDKENAKLSTSVTLIKHKSEIPVVRDTFLPAELTNVVPVIDTDDSKMVEWRVKERNDTLQDFAIGKTAGNNVEDNENRIELRNNETYLSIQAKHKNSETSDSIKITYPVNMQQPPVTIRQSVMPKWKAPGPASQNSTKLGNEKCSKSFTGLRLGLSRNTRVKPLHTNVKVQP